MLENQACTSGKPTGKFEKTKLIAARTSGTCTRIAAIAVRTNSASKEDNYNRDGRSSLPSVFLIPFDYLFGLTDLSADEFVLADLKLSRLRSKTTIATKPRTSSATIAIDRNITRSRLIITPFEGHLNTADMALIVLHTSSPGRRWTPLGCYWWRRRELNPRPQALSRQFYILSLVI